MSKHQLYLWPHMLLLEPVMGLPAGPLLQCVVWHDGSHWRAAIETSDMYEQGSDKGKLADFKPLTNYKTERQYGTFSAQDGCNFVCNIYEEGDVLSIVVDSGSHGTHVAGITAAHQPDSPSLNGIAPGKPLNLVKNTIALQSLLRICDGEAINVASQGIITTQMGAHCACMQQPTNSHICSQHCWHKQHLMESLLQDCQQSAYHLHLVVVLSLTASYHRFVQSCPNHCQTDAGAQLISCKIGDSRLGGMETGTGLTRALITVLEHKADLINMSFGEATSTPNYGRFIDLANEVV